MSSFHKKKEETFVSLPENNVRFFCHFSKSSFQGLMPIMFDFFSSFFPFPVSKFFFRFEKFFSFPSPVKFQLYFGQGWPFLMKKLQLNSRQALYTVNVIWYSAIKSSNFTVDKEKIAEWTIIRTESSNFTMDKVHFSYCLY